MVLPGPKPVDRLSCDVGLIGQTQVKKQENNKSFYKVGKDKKRKRG